jgi:hypothetical protein
MSIIRRSVIGSNPAASGASDFIIDDFHPTCDRFRVEDMV